MGVRKQILIVEDEVACQKLLTVILRQAGYDVRIVTDGSLAIQATLDNVPDLILSDVVMPGCDGLSYVRELRQRDISIPVILMTGDLDDTIQDAVDALKNCRLVAKPFHKAELLDLLSSFFGKDSVVSLMGLNHSTAGASR